jgi:hypothetical protein
MKRIILLLIPVLAAACILPAQNSQILKTERNKRIHPEK